MVRSRSLDQAEGRMMNQPRALSHAELVRQLTAARRTQPAGGQAKLGVGAGSGPLEGRTVWACSCGCTDNFVFRQECRSCGAPRSGESPSTPAGTAKGRSVSRAAKNGKPPPRAAVPSATVGGEESGEGGAESEEDLQGKLQQARAELKQAKAWVGPLRDQLMDSAQRTVESLQQRIIDSKPAAQQLRSCQDRLEAQREEIASLERDTEEARAQLDKLVLARTEAQEVLQRLEKEHAALLAKFGTAVAPSSATPAQSALEAVQALASSDVPAEVAASLGALTAWLSARVSGAPGSQQVQPGAPSEGWQVAQKRQKRGASEPPQRPSGQQEASPSDHLCMVVGRCLGTPAPTPPLTPAMLGAALERAKELGLEGEEKALREAGATESDAAMGAV